MKKILSIAISLILVSSIFLIAAPNAGAASIADVEPVDWQSGLAGRISMPELTAEESAEFARSQAVMTAQMTPPVGTTVVDWYLRSISWTYRGIRYPYMTLRALSGNVEVWVAQNESLMYLPGDPRNADPLDWYVNDAMCQFIADEFNNVIYPTCVNYFGASADRDGTNTIFELNGFPSYYYDWVSTDNPQRVIIKIFNIIDDSFFDSTYPSYVVGFFSPTYTQVYYNRNMIHIDNWRYWQRLGEEGRVWYPGKAVNRPYVYESTVVHEYQHLIHADWNPEDPSFMNEGCSMYSELLAGYGIDPAYINYYFATPDNSLIEWGDLGDIDILADYGESALWTIYLSDHYGGADLIRTFVQAGIPGIDGINDALALYGYKERFDDVFHDFRLANLIRADFPGCHKYNYESLNLNDPEIIPVRQYKIGGMPVPLTMGTSFGNSITIAGYDTGVSRLDTYGTDYITFENWTKPGFMYFDGDNVAQYGWTMTSDGWYSGLGNMMNAPLIGNAYVNPADPTLTLVTAYGLESFWDFGFVQVSTDNGQTWTSLENEYTTYDYETNVQAIIDNLPGLTDYNPDWETTTWTTMAFDLTAYSGQNVLVNFRYMTDQYENYEGWWINSATVSGTALTLAPVYPTAKFQVTVVQAIKVGKGYIYIPYDMCLKQASNKGWTLAFANKPTYVVLVISPTMPAGTVDYTVQVTKTPIWKFFQID